MPSPRAFLNACDPNRKEIDGFPDLREIVSIDSSGLFSKERARRGFPKSDRALSFRAKREIFCSLPERFLIAPLIEMTLQQTFRIALCEREYLMLQTTPQLAAYNLI
jgi:hypothetical protein